MARALKAVKEKPAPPAKLLAEELFTEIEGLVKVGAKIIIKDDNGVEIPTEKLDSAVNVIALARALVRNTDEAYKTKLAEIVKPVDVQMKQVAAEKKSIVGRAEELAKEVEAGLVDLMSDGILTPDGYVAKSGTQLTVIGKDALRVVDASLISDDFLLPRESCIDWTKVQGVLAAEKAYRETLPEGVEAPASNIKGAELVRTYTFRTKLPEEVA